MLLTDIRILDSLQIINESTDGGKRMKVRGVFQRADEANNNGRIYPKKVLESAINNLVEAVQERRCVGELDHPTYDMVKLSNASHIITNLRFEGNDVIGEAEILSTPAGKVVEALIKDGIKIGISSRGMGTLSEGKGHKIVNEDFKLLTFDIVADPSTRGAYPSLTESTQSKAVENTIKKVVGRNVFLSLLESKIDNKLDELRVNEAKKKGDPCWKGYEAIGMKTKGGRKVPNCVPVKEEALKQNTSIYTKYATKIIGEMKSFGYGKPAKKNGGKNRK